MLQSKSLRAIGQSLEILRVEAFELEKEDYSYVVRSKSLSPTSQWIFRNSVVERVWDSPGAAQNSTQVGNDWLRYDSTDISWLDAQGRKSRRSASFAQVRGVSRLSQLLRTLGEHLDVARGSSFYDRDLDCPEHNCIVEGINWYLKVLSSNDSPLAEKEVALNWIAHLVGDIHQPLHVGFKDDLGGTTTKVSFRGKEQTLHEVWDTGILETENGSAKQIAKRLDGQIRDVDRKAWQSGTPKDWANESIAINTRYVYPLPENHEISEEYAKRALPILHKRLVQAGVWLAWLLNEGLK